MTAAAYGPDLIATARRAFGHGALPAPCRTSHVDNPLCGDDVEIDIAEDGERITALAHRTRGCTFTLASASILAQTIPNMPMAEARALAVALRRDLAGMKALPESVALLSVVRMYPARTRCALLPWEALLSALDGA